MSALAVLALAALSVTVNSSATSASPGADTTRQTYLVQTAGDPVASYAGGVTGYAATKPAKGKKVNAHSAAAKAYAKLLTDRHDATLRKAGIAADRKGYDYQTVFNGFSAELTAAEAAQLRTSAGVTGVWKNETVQADTVSTDDFLGLAGSGGVWADKFGDPTRAGEGVIVGVLDSGIWAENPAFAALSEPRPDAAAIAAKWKGTCVVGVEEPIACNNKLIGARYYRAAGAGSIIPQEFLGPRGYNSHGTHTASTSVGNNNVAATINGSPVGNTTGMAPAARLAVYKVLWQNPAPDTGSSGQTADLVAAINDAVADGVDVINYSISGSTTSIVNPVEIAFFNAAASGVFVATSAGNSGPGASTVAHNAPWTMTVAASTHDRGNQKTVTLGNGASYTGVGVVSTPVASTGLVNSSAIPAAGRTVADADLCMIGSIDPAQAAGKIVVCTRGSNARVEKSQVVKAAGGVGMVLVNPAAAPGLVGDFHSVPTVHLEGAAGGDAVKAYAATPGATASLSVTDPTPVKAPVMAGFSSAGPALAGGGDLLKPDITAPGVDVIASVSPMTSNGNNFDAMSGTSMSSPHIAGIAALLLAQNPGWDPMTVKSALMTTAYQTDNKGKPITTATGAKAGPLNYGAGHVSPAKAFNPGLAYLSTPTEWMSYLCAIGQGTAVGLNCAALPQIDASDLNYPSIASSDLAVSQSFTRTVTNITDRDSVYSPTIEAPAGYTATVTPTKLKVLAGQSATFTVTLTRTTAPHGVWQFGSLTWFDKVQGHRDHTVRIPLAVRPMTVVAAGEVTGTGGTATASVKTWYTGQLTATVAGLVPATVTEKALDTSGPAFSSANPAATIRTAKLTVTVPAGSIGRFGTYGADYSATTDIDVFAYTAGTKTVVAQAADGDSEELVTLGPGTYDVYVDLYAGDPVTTVKSHVYLLGTASAGNVTVTPATQSVTTGGTATVTYTGVGLTAGLRYLGRITYGDGTDPSASSFLTITG